MPGPRPNFIKNVTELPTRVRRSREEEFTTRTSLTRPLGLIRLGVHHEVLRPGHRSSVPHAETVEEECVYVLEGNPSAWIDGTLYDLGPDDIVVFPPGTGIQHSIINRTDRDVRILVVGERVAVGRSRVGQFLAWMKEHHPEVSEPQELDEARLLEFADQFEGGKISAKRILRESWRVAFLDHVFERGLELDL